MGVPDMLQEGRHRRPAGGAQADGAARGRRGRNREDDYVKTWNKALPRGGHTIIYAGNLMAMGLALLHRRPLWKKGARTDLILAYPRG